MKILRERNKLVNLNNRLSIKTHNKIPIRIQINQKNKQNYKNHCLKIKYKRNKIRNKNKILKYQVNNLLLKFNNNLMSMIIILKF